MQPSHTVVQGGYLTRLPGYGMFCLLEVHAPGVGTRTDVVSQYCTVLVLPYAFCV